MCNYCSNCAALQARVARLEAENRRLAAENAVLRQRRRLVAAYVAAVLVRTGEVLGQRSGVQRGRWAYARGADGVARRVAGIVG